MGKLITPKRVLQLLGRFKDCRILVVGDLMLDRFIWGEVERISPEAPVPVLRITSEGFRLGGAANVIHNIRTLGGKVTACGAVGRDESGKRLLRELRRIGGSAEGVVSDGGYQTTQKTRIIASPRHQQIVRLDRESRDKLSPEVGRALRRFVEKRGPEFDAVVISDYGKGVVHPELLEAVAEMAEKDRVLCIIDPKEENFQRYRKASLVTPNKDEASAASGVRIRDESSLREAGKRLLRLWQTEAVLITRGQEGMSLFYQDSLNGYFPTAAREVFDVTGAGDTVAATCALALACRSTYEEAAVLANLAAGIVVGEVGTFAVPHDRLKKAVKAASWKNF
jgi:D-beta-D-heptose 7-phosphate kinase/D-beta-D-heptose 1-phosphate adenosyltransferase